MGQVESTSAITLQEDISYEELLELAEQSDGYLKAIAKSDINRRARDESAYRPVKTDNSFLNIQYSDNQFPKGIIVPMMSSADGGLPHTRGANVICIPVYYPKERLEGLLLHERIHLHQKAYRNEYDIFYKKWWGFKKNTYIIPENIMKLIRINPDTLGWPIYIWRDTWIPLCLFEREDKPNLRDCSYCWYNPKGGVLLKSTPPAWREFFGGVGQSEHPNELAACYGADYDRYNSNEAAKLFYSFLFTMKK